jgi:hypothetical protein
MRQITILDPTARTRSRVERLPGPVESLQGRVVAILNNRWKSMDLAAERFEAALRRDHGVKDVLQRTIPATGPAPKELIDEVALHADVAIVGLAN